MSRNTILVGTLIVVLGLAAGTWLALEPGGAGRTTPEAAGGTTSGPTGAPATTAGPEQAPAPAETTQSDTGQPAAAPAGQAETAAAPSATSSAEPEAAAESAVAPSFDIVRVEKDGSTVIAGRAAPGAEVTLLDGEAPMGTAKAGQDGSFAMVLESPLPPGSRTLTLSAQDGEGEALPSSNEVVVVVPENTPVSAAAAQETVEGAAAPAPQPAEPIVVITSRDGEGPSTVVQVPGGLGSGELHVAAVDYDLEGQVTISGKAPAGSTVLVYLNDAPIGQALAGADGTWAVTPDGSVAPGLHRLRADLLDRGGKVVARVETPFSRAEPIQLADNQTFVVVQPGNNLWLIARGHYGQGIRYTAIYEANLGQIRDPDLIYPGQIFLIPQVN